MRDHDWAVPAVQCVHILGLAVIFASMLMLDLRLIGLAGRHMTVDSLCRRFLPPLWIALPIMLATGLLLICAEPSRELENPLFWTKMALLAVTATITWFVGRRNAAHPGIWERRASGRLLGTLMLICWLGIVFCGRWIAYYSTS